MNSYKFQTLPKKKKTIIILLAVCLWRCNGLHDWLTVQQKYLDFIQFWSMRSSLKNDTVLLKLFEINEKSYMLGWFKPEKKKNTEPNNFSKRPV